MIQMSKKMSKIAYKDYDNWKDFNYHDRYLDAFASLFHVQSPVAVATKLESVIYLSYNSQVNKPNKASVLLIEKLVKNAGSYEDFLLVYLLFNVDFIDLVRKTKKHINEHEPARKLLEYFVNIYKCKEKIDKEIKKIENIETLKQCIDNKIKKIKEIENIEVLKQYTYNLVESYYAIIDTFSSNTNLKQYLDTFLRPLQDTNKLYKYLNDNLAKVEINLLDNYSNIHADTNASHHLTDKNKNYIGVSKLCCGYCHKYLLENEHPHRGTHGVCDDKWNLPLDKTQEFKDSLLPISNFNQSKLPQQHRRLSTDEEYEELQVLKDYKRNLNSAQPSCISYKEKTPSDRAEATTVAEQNDNNLRAQEKQETEAGTHEEKSEGASNGTYDHSVLVLSSSSSSINSSSSSSSSSSPSSSGTNRDQIGTKNIRTSILDQNITKKQKTEIATTIHIDEEIVERTRSMSFDEGVSVTEDTDGPEYASTEIMGSAQLDSYDSDSYPA